MDTAVWIRKAFKITSLEGYNVHVSSQLEIQFLAQISLENWLFTPKVEECNNTPVTNVKIYNLKTEYTYRVVKDTAGLNNINLYHFWINK